MFSFLSSHWPFSQLRRETQTEAALGWIFLSSNILFSASYTIFAKLLSGSLSPLTILFISESLTIFFAFFFFGTVPLLKQLFHTKKKSFAPMLTIGLTNGILGPLLWFSGLQYTSIVNAALFGNTEMMFLAIFAVLILREEWTLAHFLSISAIIVGITIISLRGFTDGLELQTGDILIVLAGLCFAIGSVVFRKYLHDADPQVVVLVRSLVPVSLFFFIAPFIHTPLISEAKSLSWALVGIVLAFGLVSRFMNTFTFYEALDRLPVSTVSLFSNLAMVVAIIFAAVFLKEEVLPYHIVGGSFILFGTLLLEVIGVHPSEEHLEKHLTERKTSRG